MDILHLIDRLEELVGESRRLPVGGGAVIPRQRLLDLIDRMRVAVPREIYDSRELLEQKEEVLRLAHEEAAILLAEAREEMEKRLKETEVVKAAEERSRQLVGDAQEKAGQLLISAEEQARARLDEAQQESHAQMKEADAYALQTLKKLENELDVFLTTVRKGVEALEQRAAERPGN